MKLTLIIPDLHLKWEKADKIIKHVGADEVIFLGDYFDDFNDDAHMINEMVDWLGASVKVPGRIHLYGNHDIHYAFTQPFYRCSGYAQWKHFIIHDALDPRVWDWVKFYHILDGKWLVSHAGLHSLHVPKKISALSPNRAQYLKEIDNYLDAEVPKAHRNESWLFKAGQSRGGMQRVGGIIWCDFEQEFHPVVGLNQIFGHTPQSLGTAKWCYMNKGKVSYRPIGSWTPNAVNYDDVRRSYNVCLDVHANMHWAVWNGKTLKFGNYRDDL
jgi:hypothetical protein